MKMLFSRMRANFLISLLLISCFAAHGAESEGIFADFTTSMGSFTCRLEYARAPRTVANFIGLASGQRAWLDLTNGMARSQPFFNGVLFHRVIRGFMIQGGSPGGLGTDGPGYSFEDEFDPTLRHDSFGVLSMANSGPDSNGSQFFITVGATPWLNDLHTVFGRLVDGSNVVYNISRVPTDNSDRPLTSVVINDVQIRRVGAAAEAFDIHAQGLPVVTNINLGISRVGSGVVLSVGGRTNVDNRLYSSTNLHRWTGTSLGLATLTPLSTVTVNQSAPFRFFRVTEVQYPPSLFVPPHLAGRILNLNFQTGAAMVLTFDNAGNATYIWTTPGNEPSSGFVLAYQWTQDPYRGRFKPAIVFSNVIPMELHLDFDSPTAGTFKGTAFPFYPSSQGATPVSGTLTLSP